MCTDLARTLWKTLWKMIFILSTLQHYRSDKIHFCWQELFWQGISAIVASHIRQTIHVPVFDKSYTSPIQSFKDRVFTYVYLHRDPNDAKHLLLLWCPNFSSIKNNLLRWMMNIQLDCMCIIYAYERHAKLKLDDE